MRKISFISSQDFILESRETIPDFYLARQQKKTFNKAIDRWDARDVKLKTSS